MPSHPCHRSSSTPCGTVHRSCYIRTGIKAHQLSPGKFSPHQSGMQLLVRVLQVASSTSGQTAQDTASEVQKTAFPTSNLTGRLTGVLIGDAAHALLIARFYVECRALSRPHNRSAAGARDPASWHQLHGVSDADNSMLAVRRREHVPRLVHQAAQLLSILPTLSLSQCRHCVHRRPVTAQPIQP